MADSAHPTNPDPTWSWDDIPGGQGKAPEATTDDANHPFDSDPEHPHPSQPEAEETGPDPSEFRRRYKPRTCRICLDEVEPTVEFPSSTTQFLGRKPHVRYVSEDPELGRLLRPCSCRGSQKYVHEGCLRAWRRASPSQRNLWECPTCKYQYRLERLTWAKWATSKLVRALLTLLILFLTVFILGFVADPIIYLWSDPISAVVDGFSGSFDEFDELRDWLPEDELPDTWPWHFYRGFFALGLVGLVKSFFAMRPWHWWNVRIGAGGGRRGGRGRDRLENISMLMVVIGVVTFLSVSIYPCPPVRGAMS